MTHEIVTTHGTTTEDQLLRTVIFEDRPDEYVVATEWRLAGHDGIGCEFCEQPDLPEHLKPVAGVVLVRRDCWTNSKRPSVVATAIAGGLPPSP